MSKANRILIVEDEINLARILRAEMEHVGWQVQHTDTGEKALVLLEEVFDVMLLDMNLPGMSGMEVFQSIQSEALAPEVVILTGNADVERAVQAMKMGAYDYLQKPVSTEKLFLVLEKAAEKNRLKFTNFLLERRARGTENGFNGIVIADPAMKKTYELAERVAASDAAVLILGETGTGKDIMANYIHRNSSRSRGPFVSLNCAAFQENMLENELFGHERGAFTDASERKLGFFEIASDGTLFLDEISEMSLGMQAKLLHVLEKNEFYRVGGTRLIKANTRVLVASNRELDRMVEEGSFRRDLYYRINMLSLTVPPLRERKEEIIPLTEKFIEDTSAMKVLSDRAKASLLGYDWPGNVRELKHVIQRAVIISRGEFIDEEDIVLTPSGGGVKEQERVFVPLEEMEAKYIFEVLNSVNWKRSVAANILELDPKTLYRKIIKYGLSTSNS